MYSLNREHDLIRMTTPLNYDRTISVGISDMRVSNRVGDVLITYALGSCVGVAMYDAIARVGGMVHCMLPLSKADPVKAMESPCMFVDTGIPMLFNALRNLGASKENLVVKVAGCAEILSDNGLFKIGERNYTIVRKILWKNNILINGEHVGGNSSRTMLVDIATGRVIVRTSGEEVVI